MAKLIGNKNISVFISGRGSNLKALINYEKKNKKFKISCIISDNRNAKGLKIAKKYKIKYFIINFKKKTDAELKIYNYLKNKNVSLIALAGFMKILSKKFIKKIKIPILNIHPSLLPKYKGLNTHEKAIINKDKYSGCSVHIVNEKIDAGKILSQKKVRVLKSDNKKTLESKILKQEHRLYPKVIDAYLN